MAKMYMSDSDDEPKKGSSRKSRVHVPEDSDESVMGLSDDSDEDDDLDDEFSENDYGADQGQAKDQYNYDDFDEEEDEFGNVHAIRAKKQEMGSDIEDENEDCEYLN